MGRNIAYRRIDASDERQYMLNEAYEVYEKIGAPTGAEVAHCHNFYEVIYVCEGEFASIVDDRTYYLKKGDFLLIDCNVMHRYHHEEKKHDSSRRIILWISEKMLAEIGSGYNDLSMCFRKAKESSAAYHFPIYYDEMLRNYLLKLAQENVSDVELVGAKEILDRSYMALFFVYMNELCMKEKHTLAAENVFFSEMVRSVSSYIDANIKEELSLDILAEYVHTSKYYFLRRFKEETGMTVHEYINNKRLIKAREMLRENFTLTECWQESGFNDYTTFLRNFKKVFGVPPSAVSKV